MVPFEHTEFTEETVTLFSSYVAGTNIVRIGEDIRKGSLLTEKGTLIDPGVMGSLAAQNISRPLVYRRPRVAVLATGSELVELGHDLAPGKIHDTNSYSMAGAIRDQGAEPVYYRAVSDSVEAIAEGLEKSLAECDAVVTTGGVSVGDYDLTPAAMEAIGAEIFFRKVDLKPGMACAYGQKNGKLICGSQTFMPSPCQRFGSSADLGTMRFMNSRSAWPSASGRQVRTTACCAASWNCPTARFGCVCPRGREMS